MICTITNRSRSLVSFRGNSGQTWHLPPETSLEVMVVEVTENAKIEKLTELGMIDVQSGQPSKVTAGAPEKRQKSRARGAER
jgi:hypothetical protein